MSTRSFIGIVAGDTGIHARYHHWDGYPTGVAATLLRLARGSDLADLRAVLIDYHPAGFSTINQAQTLADFENAGFTENRMSDKRAVECFCHGDRAEDEQLIVCRCGTGDASQCDPLFLEWGYVLNTAGLDVYKSLPTGVTHTVEGAAGPYETPGYAHVLVGTLPWDADLVAVEAIEERGHEMAEAAYEIAQGAS